MGSVPSLPTPYRKHPQRGEKGLLPTRTPSPAPGEPLDGLWDPGPAPELGRRPQRADPATSVRSFARPLPLPHRLAREMGDQRLRQGRQAQKPVLRSSCERSGLEASAHRSSSRARFPRSRRRPGAPMRGRLRLPGWAHGRRPALRALRAPCRSGRRPGANRLGWLLVPPFPRRAGLADRRRRGAPRDPPGAHGEHRRLLRALSATTTRQRPSTATTGASSPTTTSPTCASTPRWPSTPPAPTVAAG